MAKGLYTQGVVVLFERAPDLPALERALGAFDVLDEAQPAEDWPLGGPGLLVSYREEVRGVVMVDVVEQGWPDTMGDPTDEPVLFAAWTTGQFGPFAYPGGLERAGEQCWREPGLGEAVAAHGAFVRVRLSYVFGAGQDDPVMPEDCDPRDELSFVTRLAAAVCSLPGALGYFNPSGEVLASPGLVLESSRSAAERDLPPLDLWSNIRFFHADPQWRVMDSVGNWQLDLPDLEVVFRPDAAEPGDVDPFIRNATLYLLKEGPVVQDGDTVDGPGEIRFQVHALAEGASDPPRPVLRMVPEGATDLPPGLDPDEAPEGGADAPAAP